MTDESDFERIVRTYGDALSRLAWGYVEHASEWQEILATGGALEYCNAARLDGVVRLLGLTSHQRRLAAEAARSGLLDMLMIRYNAAHRGAETEVFPSTEAIHHVGPDRALTTPSVSVVPHSGQRSEVQSRSA